MFKLIIGNKNYSSWSLRPWLLLRAFDVPFEEVKIFLATETTAEEIIKYSFAGKVPVLFDGEVKVWDSLAICEYISEQYLEGKGWPADPAMRALARSCCAEMHSGFFSLRERMPMNCKAVKRKVQTTNGLEMDIARIDQLWQDLRLVNTEQGPWLFGDFSIADCMFAPVVFRFITYGVSLSQTSSDYVAKVSSHPRIIEWLDGAKLEDEIITSSEVGVVE